MFTRPAITPPDLDEIWGKLTPSILSGAGSDRFWARSSQKRERESHGYCFGDSKSVIMTDYLSKGCTVTGTYYADKLCKLLEALKSKRGGKLRRWVLLLHDNAPAHTSAVATSAAAECGDELLQHPLYSPDLAASDFYLFPLLKEHFIGTFFNWQWRHCVCRSLVPSAARWTLLQDWHTKAAEMMEQVHWSWRRLCGKINKSLLFCCVSLYMRPETFGTTLVVTIYTVACSSIAACRRPANSFVAAAAAHLRRHSIRHTSMLVARTQCSVPYCTRDRAAADPGHTPTDWRVRSSCRC